MSLPHCARRLPVRLQSTLASAAPTPGAVRHSYFVPRNSRGSIPVYTDTRMNNKYYTLIRNVQGNADVSCFSVASRRQAGLLTSPCAPRFLQDLAREMQAALFPPGTPEATRLAVATVRGRHVVLTGGHWKREVVQWLQSRGF